MGGRAGRLARRGVCRAAGAGRAAAALAVALLLAGCAGVHRGLDHWVLDRKAGLLSRDDDAPRPSGARLEYARASELERLTRPAGPPQVALAPLTRHRLGVAGIVEEELTFPSAVQLRYRESDVARAYLYRLGRLGERPLVVWSPGQSTSDTSFKAIEPYLRELLARGVDVAFFVPPYHLERTPAGYPSGDAFLATDFSDHLAAFAQAVSDLRALVSWLQAQGVERLGAMGSSMGAWILLRVASWDECFSFMTLVAPVVRWELLMFQPEMSALRTRLLAQGLSAEQAVRAYRALDPTPARPRLEPGRISIYYGRFDRVAPAPAVLEWAERWGVLRVRGFDRGHATIFLSSALGREVRAGLERDLASLGWLVHGQAGPNDARLAPGFRPVGWPMCE